MGDPLLDRLDTSTHVLHVGAHIGQEIPNYMNKWHPHLKTITLVECIPDVFDELLKNVKLFDAKYGIQINAVEALLSDTVGDKKTFHITDNCGLSSSMLEPDPTTWPWDWVKPAATIELETDTADHLKELSILTEPYDTVVLDTQGNELRVLRGMKTLLPHVKQMIIEFSRERYYKGAVLLSELQAFLEESGFVITYLPDVDHGDLVCKRRDTASA